MREQSSKVNPKILELIGESAELTRDQVVEFLAGRGMTANQATISMIVAFTELTKERKVAYLAYLDGKGIDHVINLALGNLIKEMASRGAT